MKSRFILIDCVSNKKIYFELKNNENSISTHKGNISIENIQNAKWGSVIKTHKDYPYRIVEVDIHDFIMYGLKRETQIIYPKDAAFIVNYLSIKNGDKVFECGCGSGALTLTMANCVAPDGKVICYEKRKKFIELALSNLEFNNLKDYVQIIEKNLEESDLDEKNFDAAFIDVKEPWKIISKVSSVMKSGKKLGILVPTMNQVIDVLKELQKNKHFDVSLQEIFIRNYKVLPDRVRPDDRMVAHTGYLIFSRKGE